MKDALSETIQSWNRFWFTPQKPNRIGTVRVFVGSIVTIKFLILLLVATEWIGTAGWLNTDATRYLIGDGVEGTGSSYRWSLLYIIPGSGVALAVIGMAASGSLALGLGSRLSPVIAWAMLGMFHHRAPMLISIADPLMSAMLVYLIIDPGKTTWDLKPGLASGEDRIGVNIARRLIQCHLVIWMVFSLSTMLSFVSWWNGEAAWALLEPMRSTWKIGDQWQWTGQWLTHCVIALQFAVLASIPATHWRWLGRWMMYLFIACMLLLAKDWMYAAILLVASLTIWPVSIPFGKVSHDKQR